SQVDLGGRRSGLTGIEELLGGIESVAFVHMTRTDVVRHRIVADIVEAYERHEASEVERHHEH
ncbi:MAG: PhoH family protein, partial [Actinomycetes bacterium]